MTNSFVTPKGAHALYSITCLSNCFYAGSFYCVFEIYRNICSFRDHESFNKEVFVDLIAAQIKTLSFLAYILKIYQDVVAQHSPKLVSGMLTLLALCPNEVAHLRKELLIATKHILALELRNSKL